MKSIFRGPLNADIARAQVRHDPLPDRWFAADFDDRDWSQATEYTRDAVDPKEAFYAADFEGAKFIWSDDLDLDNTVLFRVRIDQPGWKPRWTTHPDLDVSGELPR